MPVPSTLSSPTIYKFDFTLRGVKMTKCVSGTNKDKQLSQTKTGDLEATLLKSSRTRKLYPRTNTSTEAMLLVRFDLLFFSTTSKMFLQCEVKDAAFSHEIVNRTAHWSRCFRLSQNMIHTSTISGAPPPSPQISTSVDLLNLPVSFYSIYLFDLFSSHSFFLSTQHYSLYITQWVLWAVQISKFTLAKPKVISICSTIFALPSCPQ